MTNLNRAVAGLGNACRFLSSARGDVDQRLSGCYPLLAQLRPEDLPEDPPDNLRARFEGILERFTYAGTVNPSVNLMAPEEAVVLARGIFELYSDVLRQASREDGGNRDEE